MGLIGPANLILPNWCQTYFNLGGQKVAFGAPAPQPDSVGIRFAPVRHCSLLAAIRVPPVFPLASANLQSSHQGHAEECRRNRFYEGQLRLFGEAGPGQNRPVQWPKPVAYLRCANPPGAHKITK